MISNNTYNLVKIHKPEELQGIMHDAELNLRFVEENIKGAPKEIANELLENIFDISEICTGIGGNNEFSDQDWAKGFEIIGESLKRVKEKSLHLYATLIEKNLVNPFNGKPDNLRAMILVVSKVNKPNIQIDAAMLHDTPVKF